MVNRENGGICELCGAAFVITRPEKRFCSRRCATVAANRRKIARKKEEIAKLGTDCKYNGALLCKDRKCDTCGWNPKVANRRLLML